MAEVDQLQTLTQISVEDPKRPVKVLPSTYNEPTRDFYAHSAIAEIDLKLQKVQSSEIVSEPWFVRRDTTI